MKKKPNPESLLTIVRIPWSILHCLYSLLLFLIEQKLSSLKPNHFIFVSTAGYCWVQVTSIWLLGDDVATTQCVIRFSRRLFD